MTTLREAAQQALEALEVATNCLDGYYIPRGKTTLPEIEDAITALKAALAEPVQEPVANDDKVICPACCHQFRAIPPNVQQMMLDAGFEPPFTTPPQRKPLSDADLVKIWDDALDQLDQRDQLRFIARAIERAHGIGEQQ